MKNTNERIGIVSIVNRGKKTGHTSNITFKPITGKCCVTLLIWVNHFFSFSLTFKLTTVKTVPINFIYHSITIENVRLHLMFTTHLSNPSLFNSVHLFFGYFFFLLNLGLSLNIAYTSDKNSNRSKQMKVGTNFAVPFFKSKPRFFFKVQLATIPGYLGSNHCLKQ